MIEAKELKMPFWLKINLTIKEAAEYSDIGINRIEDLLKQPKCNFVLYVGNKKMVKRKEFEQYLSKALKFKAFMMKIQFDYSKIINDMV